MTESEKFIEALEIVDRVQKNDNVGNWTNTILSSIYTQAIDGTTHLCKIVKGKCKNKKAIMISSLPALGTFQKPKPEEAIPLCKPSHFGRGDELAYDESVRKSVEHEISDTKDVHASIIKAATSAAVQLFGPMIALTADKLVIYSSDGKFDKHRDSIKSEKHIGTVVVQLPIDCTGGQLQLDGVPKPASVTLDDSGSDYCYNSDDGWGAHATRRKCQLIATAFYTDVVHWVTPVESGHRVTVTFRVEKSDTPVQLKNWGIVKKNEETPKAVCGSGYDGLDTSNVDLWQDMEELETSDDDVPLQLFLDTLKAVDHSTVVIGCRHMIPRAALNLEGLRGVDKIVAQKLIAEGYRVKVVLVTVEEIKGDDNCEIDGCSIYVCDLPSRWCGAIFIRPTDNYEAVVIEAGKRHMQHIGNQPGEVEALRYISAAFLVQRQDS